AINPNHYPSPHPPASPALPAIPPRPADKPPPWTTLPSCQPPAIRTPTRVTTDSCSGCCSPASSSGHCSTALRREAARPAPISARWRSPRPPSPAADPRRHPRVTTRHPPPVATTPPPGPTAPAPASPPTTAPPPPNPPATAPPANRSP